MCIYAFLFLETAFYRIYAKNLFLIVYSCNCISIIWFQPFTSHLPISIPVATVGSRHKNVGCGNMTVITSDLV